MKKSIILMMLFACLLGLTACGKKETEFVSTTFGDITVSVPSNFGAVEENQGLYMSSGQNASIIVSPATEIELLPSEWDEGLAADLLEPLFGATYTDLELTAFEGNVDMNGNTAVTYAFNGKNSNGIERHAQIVMLYNSDLSAQYSITLIHDAEDEAFTSEIDEQIINSITLND